MSCISTIGMRRAIRTRISPRHLRSGSRRSSIGASDYAGWKALQKLEYIDELMRSLAGKPPVHTPEYRVADYDCLNVKLKTYYARKRKLTKIRIQIFTMPICDSSLPRTGWRSRQAPICAGGGGDY